MEKNLTEELEKIYQDKFKPAFETENYFEAHKIYNENPGLDNFMTNSEMKGMLEYILTKNDSDLKEILSDSIKIKNNLENN
ncbi:MAG: hypothetical protein WC812_03555 [Candidatus Pacearchaeota archaeon]|jgi:hypothetical protein